MPPFLGWQSEQLTLKVVAVEMTTSAKQFAREFFGGLGRGTMLCRDILASACKIKPVWHDILYQMYFIGVKSQSVVTITGAFTGMVLCAQTYLQFHKIKMDTAAMAAELGTMRVTEQIDALRTLAADPIDYLVVPRFLAMLLVMPLLTLESICVGIFAGFMVGTGLLGINPTYLWYNMVHHTNLEDMAKGIIKTFLFGAAIAVIACDKGLNCPQGAEGVGRATTEAVVYASITILVSNFFLTILLNTFLV
jgi:phospholipid/cholesterol/gamma-HCH transport system permease protein